MGQKVVGYSHSIYDTIVPLGTSCLADQYFSMQNAVPGKNSDVSFSPETQISPSSTLEATQKEYSYLVSLRQIYLCSATKVSGVLTYSYVGKPEAVI